MKKLGLLFGTALACVTVGALPASAYPPPTAVLLAPSTVVAGQPFTATLVGCTDGETVNFTLDGTTVPATCGDAAAGWRRPAAPTGPTATATLTAPTVPGTYTLVATGLTSGVTASATITVVGAVPGTAAPGGGLPATGSDSAPTVQIASGIIVVGLGLAVVGGVRRRKRATA